MTRKVVFFVTFCSAAWRVFGGEHPLTSTYAYQCDTVRHRIDVAE